MQLLRLLGLPDDWLALLTDDPKQAQVRRGLPHLSSCMNG
jgi:hypothetical protein